MHLKARVRSITGNATNLRIQSGLRSGNVTEMPSAIVVEILEQDGGAMLLRFGYDGEFSGDTWHENVDSAKRQAAFEFDIREEDWEDVELRH